MTTLLSCIVDELHLRYPQATPQAISQALITSIENEILPVAIKIMKLPPYPSKMQLLLERKRMERQKKKHRYSTEKRKKRLIEDFERIKYLLNGHFNDYTAEEQFLELDGSVSDSPLEPRFLGTTFQQGILERNDGIPTSPKVGYSRSKKPTEQEKGNPYSKILFSPEKETSQFIISNKIQERILSNITLRDIVSSIEIQLRKISTRFPKMAFSIDVKNDEEIPTWEKIIINLKFPSLDVNKKLELWDQIDFQIRKAVLDANRRVDSFDETELKKLNKKIYIHLEL